MSEHDESREPLAFDMRRQPDDVTCGPTCLHAVYGYFGEELALGSLLEEVQSLEEGGTLGVHLANHALARGYRATLVTWNLQIFDPTWFDAGGHDLRERLLARAQARDEPKLLSAMRAYVDFLDRGGRIELQDLTPALLRRFLKKRLPILTGLSATFLYREARERSRDNRPDDVAGDPVGHFVVLTGYDREKRRVFVSDPMHPNPLSVRHTYSVEMERVIGAIYLGVLTYDANLVVLEPAGGGPAPSRANDRRRQ